MAATVELVTVADALVLAAEIRDGRKVRSYDEVMRALLSLVILGEEVTRLRDREADRAN